MSSPVGETTVEAREQVARIIAESVSPLSFDQNPMQDGYLAIADKVLASGALVPTPAVGDSVHFIDSHGFRRSGRVVEVFPPKPAQVIIDSDEGDNPLGYTVKIDADEVTVDA